MRASKLKRIEEGRLGRLQKKRIHKHITQSRTEMNMRKGRQEWIARRDKKK